MFQRLALQAIVALSLTAAIGGGVWWLDRRGDIAETKAAAAQARADSLESQLEDARGNVKVVTQFVDRIQTIREVGRTIEREVPVYVTQQADAACVIPRGFVQLHDAAATGVPTAGSPVDPDAPAAGLALSAVAETVAGNYTSCHETAAQLKALQDKLQSIGVRVDG